MIIIVIENRTSTYHNASVNAASIRRARTMTRIAAEDAPARDMRQRRQAARKAGYHGPLTRAELTTRAANS